MAPYARCSKPLNGDFSARTASAPQIGTKYSVSKARLAVPNRENERIAGLPGQPAIAWNAVLLADPTSELTGSLSQAQWKLFVNLKHFFNHVATGKKSPETA